jgi:fluoride exporter
MSRDARALPSVPLSTLAVISAGGVLGALARYGLTSAFPSAPSAFDWAVFGINVGGCFAIGIVIVLATESRRAHRLVRPFLATGVLGGFTTFSTYIVGMQRALTAHVPRVALIYGAATVVAALTAAWAGIGLANGVVAAVRRRPRLVEDEAS